MDLYENFKVPTCRDGVWEYTTFADKIEFRDFLIPLFKTPGTYKFTKEVYEQINPLARKFIKKGYFCDAPNMSEDFITFWDFEKEKCMKGLIIISKGETFYLTRDYYFWVNFLPIYIKLERVYKTPNIYDTQYHWALYEVLAELHDLMGAMLKKRQIASSYFHAAKMLNYYWFEEGSKIKMGGSLKKYINSEGTWKYLEEYESFLNEYTAWYRPRTGGVGRWEQKYKVTINNREIEKGLKSQIEGISFEKSATSGVGGPCRFFFHEEAGIAPRMNTTFEYMLPALKDGGIATGFFMAAGSVGDLAQCNPLKNMIINPRDHDIYPVTDNLIDSKGTIVEHGLFIPEQWSMQPFMDEYGNSDVEGALKQILEERVLLQKRLDPETYQLRISQKPINIEEAFAFRKESVYPLHLVQKQQALIKAGEYAIEYVDLEETPDKKIVVGRAKRKPIMTFPVDKKMVDKRACTVIYERPIPNPKFGTYYASVDPVATGKTTTSDSLCSIIVYKNDLEIIATDKFGETKSTVEHGKIVCTWTGRYDDLTDTHTHLELIVKYYNAWTLVEANVSQFILHMIRNRLQKYLVPKDQIVFLKELKANGSSHQDYGWKNVGTMFKAHLIFYGIDFLKEVIDEEFDDDGNVTGTVLGHTRIPDIMILEEMMQYQDGLNVDRLISFSALMAFVSLQNANRGYMKVHQVDKNLESDKNLYKLSKSPFKNIGHSETTYKKNRGAFKNIR